MPRNHTTNFEQDVMNSIIGHTEDEESTTEPGDTEELSAQAEDEAGDEEED